MEITNTAVDNWLELKLKGMRTVLYVFLLLIGGNSFGQSATPAEMTKKFYDALNKGDSVFVATLLSENVEIAHYENDTSYSFNKERFLPICQKFVNGKYREEFQITQEISYPGTDIIEVSFEFYLDGMHHHCGKDVVIFKGDKIASLHSYITPCEKESGGRKEQISYLTEKLNAKMNDWHKAAANANFKDYFGFMATDFYYLGTDPAERWTKEQFGNFCRPYFDKGEAWTFTTKERNFYFSDDLKTVWFDEKLNTWMEECRGSGVIVLENLTNGDWSDWKLKHYNLTVTIENDKIQDFIKLRKQ